MNMKKIKMLSSGLILSIIFLSAKAQEMQNSKPLLVHTVYLNINTDNRMINIDSVLQIMKKYVLEPNQYYTSTKIAGHWYGHDSREVLIISECKSWDDVTKAEARQDEIISQLMKDKTRQPAGKMWQSLIFPEHHSDEIYRVIAE
jgi:hypothetical protein